MVSFDTERLAKIYFKDVDVEPCEICGRWTASLADHDEGEINGGICNDEGTEHIYDRVCETCQEEYEERSKTINLIHVGQKFYRQSGTRMSSIYEIDADAKWIRWDWGKVQVALEDGRSVNIVPANKEQLEIAEALLEA